jgi:uncharacterized protein YbjT (DUF2867 family)
MIVVTTPTGAIGRQVLEHLLDSINGNNSSERIRVIARDPARLAPGTRDRVEVVQGSQDDPDVVDRAFAGADTVFWVVPPNFQAPTVEAGYLDFTRPACHAIQRRGVTRVVSVSALGRGVNANGGNFGVVSASLAKDDMIAATGVHFRALALPSFMDNILRQKESIASQGVFRLAITADLKLPTCCTRDIAAAAAPLLLDASWSGQDNVPVLGPEDLSFNDMARIMSEVLGKPVRYQEIPVESYKAFLIAQGASQNFAQAMADMIVAKNEGLDKAEPRTPRSSSPTSFRQWCEEVLMPAIAGAPATV